MTERELLQKIPFYSRKEIENRDFSIIASNLYKEIERECPNHLFCLIQYDLTEHLQKVLTNLAK